MGRVARVVISNIIKKIDRPYDYLCEDGALLTGRRVIVPFGRANAPRKALVLDCFDSEETQNFKSIIEVLDEKPILLASQIPLISFIKKHYFIPYYRAFSCLIPAGLDYKVKKTYCATGKAESGKYEALTTVLSSKKGGMALSEIPVSLQPLIRPAMEEGYVAEQVTSKRNLGDLADKMLALAVSREMAEEYMQELTARMQGQRELIELLLTLPNVTAKEALYMTGCSVSNIQTLSRNGIIRVFYEPRTRDPYENLPKTEDESEIVLNEEQASVYNSIASSLFEGAKTHLIHGVTGSGKTHVYMKLMDRVLDAGKSVLFLVPEISLTPQTLVRFFARYGQKVAVLHSGLSMGQRMDEWKKIRSAEVSLVVGTRSAVFAPVANLGLIIMDEEHEASYKSESAPKYHARDVALFLCRQFDIPLVLGSATPSLESYYKAKKGNYILHTLSMRFNAGPLPAVEMVDMRESDLDSLVPFLSDSLRDGIAETLENKEQSILFLNRRGARTHILCQKCGFTLTCPSCGIAMTYHSANNRCICHFCSYSIKMPTKCPECGDSHIRMNGYGTQLVEERLRGLYPTARILRMDMDTVTNYISYQTMMDAFAKGDYDILLGTQMVAKGLNFPGVTMVGVLQADMSLYIDDFRAGERTFSLLTQVCGRSGRADKSGRAIIQSYCPDHEVLRFAENQDYTGFYDYEIKFRKAIKYPPFCDICLLTVSSGAQSLTYTAANALFDAFEQYAKQEDCDIPLRLFRPTVPRIARIGEKYRMQMLIKCRNSAKFRRLTDECMEKIMGELNVLISADINPLSF